MTLFKQLIKLELMRKGVMSIHLPHEGCPAVDLIHPFPVYYSETSNKTYNTFRKIFATKSFDVATDCVLYFGCAVQDTLCKRKSKFLTKLKYKTTSNLLNHAVQKVASDELAELQKINYFLSNALSYYLK